MAEKVVSSRAPSLARPADQLPHPLASSRPPTGLIVCDVTHLSCDCHAEPSSEPSGSLCPPDHLGRLETAPLEPVRTRLRARLDDLGWHTDEAGYEFSRGGGEHVDQGGRQRRQQQRQGVVLQRLVRREERSRYT
jgi:hypothetical protein